MRVSILAVALSICQVSSSLPVHDGEEWIQEKRAACNHDNVLRALLGNSAAATPFCSIYLDIPTATTYAPGITPAPTTTYTFTASVTSYPSQYLPYILPTYLYSYPIPSRISSACSCLSVPETTTTLTTTPTAATITTTTTIPFTGACATETPVRGAYNLSSTASDAFLYTIPFPEDNGAYPNSAVPDCCSVCSAYNPYPNASGSDREGYFGNCIGYVSPQAGTCTLLLQGHVGAGYLGELCSAYGFQPGTLYVDPTQHPYAAGGKGQCASTFTVITT